MVNFSQSYEASPAIRYPYHIMLPVSRVIHGEAWLNKRLF